MSDPNYDTGHRADSIHRTMTNLRNALASIVYENGDCMRQDEPVAERGTPCGCPVCIAKAALESEEEWRFMGYLPERRGSSSPTGLRERAIHAAWRHYFMKVGGMVRNNSRQLDAMLAKIIGVGDETQITQRDWLVATTIVQWLTTNVGQCILNDAGYHHNPERVTLR